MMNPFRMNTVFSADAVKSNAKLHRQNSVQGFLLQMEIFLSDRNNMGFGNGKMKVDQKLLHNKQLILGNILLKIAFSAGYRRLMFTLLIPIISVNFACIVTEYKSDLLKWDYSIS